MNDEVTSEARRAIEAIVMVADQPIEPNLLAQVLELPQADVESLCEALAAEYQAEGRGFELVRVAGGYRYRSHPDQAPYVERFVLEGQSARLSAAALETLAIVAYKQPVSRMQVAAIRGVNVDAVVRTLEHRGYIAEVSRDPGPGQAVLFGTTQLFLERLGLDSLDELPSLGDFVPGADIVEALERGLRPESAESVEAALADDESVDEDEGLAEADAGDDAERVAFEMRSYGDSDALADPDAG
jgi:segregation and condensation protein B